MSWVFWVLSAHFLWAIVNVGDKYIVGKRIKNPYVYMVWLAIFGFLVVLLIPFVDLALPNFKVFLYVFLGGAAYFFGGLPYIKAMQIEEPTRINIWWNLIPIFSFLLGWCFFGETLTPAEFLAFIILIIGAFIASIHIKQKFFTKKNLFSFSRAFWLMLLACLSYSIYAILLDQAVREISFLSAFVWSHIVMFVCSLTLFIFKKFRNDFKKETRSLRGSFLYFVLLIALLDHTGTLLIQKALAVGKPSLVFSLEGTQVIMVFALATFLSIFYPRVVKEELDKKNIVLKIFAIILMIIGILILNLG